MTLPTNIAKALLLSAQHLRDEEFAGYIDNSLNAAERLGVETHLKTCLECRQEMMAICEAVEADIADPTRLDELVTCLAAEPGPATPNRAPVPTTSLGNVLDDIGQAATGLVQKWFGPVSSWATQAVVADVALADSRPAFSGVQMPLDDLFDKSVLETGLAWAQGPLALAAVYDEAGLLRSVRASIGVRGPDRQPSAIVLTLSDAAEGRSVLRLTQGRPSDVCAAPQIKGLLERLNVAVALEEVGDVI